MGIARTDDQKALAGKIGSRVIAARQKLGWSQERLARRGGVSRETVRRVESGIGYPDLGTLGVLASALDLEWTDLLPSPNQLSAVHIERYPQTPTDLLLPVSKTRRRSGNRDTKALARTG